MSRGLTLWVLGLTAAGCLQFEPLVAPPDTDLSDAPVWNSCEGFVGTDFLIVVDNSSSMAEEQYDFSTEVYSLANVFSHLLYITENRTLQDVEELRVAVVSTDLGLQYGEEGTVGAENMINCGGAGDDGQFQTDIVDEVTIESGAVQCHPDAGIGCPDEWQCVDGRCQAPDGADAGVVPCHPVAGEYADYTVDDSTILPNHIACMAQLGTGGCGIEQQLQSGIRALTREDQNAFLADNHRLVILVVSDEEDCSIRDPGLFDTPEWNSLEERGTACNYPVSNGENYLFEPTFMLDRMVALKGGRTGGVALIAAVGVPMSDRCEGFGDEIDDCLTDPAMAYEVETLPPPDYQRLRPACTREKDGVLITEATPGRRYVEAVQAFGPAGYVYSICRESWANVMTELSYLIGLCMPLS